MLNLDDIGAGQVRRGLRFLGNLRNFRNLNKKEKAKTVILPALLFSGFGFTALQGHQVTKYLNLNEADQVLMAQCERNYDEGNLLFEDGVPSQSGCACTAKLVSSSVPTSHHSHFKTAHNLLLQSYFIQAQGETQDASQANYESQPSAMITAEVRSADFNSEQLATLVDIIGSADMKCSDRTLYTKANLMELGKLEPYAEMIVVDKAQGVVELTLRGATAPVRLSQN